MPLCVGPPCTWPCLGLGLWRSQNRGRSMTHSGVSSSSSLPPTSAPDMPQVPKESKFRLTIRALRAHAQCIDHSLPLLHIC